MQQQRRILRAPTMRRRVVSTTATATVIVLLLFVITLVSLVTNFYFHFELLRNLTGYLKNTPPPLYDYNTADQKTGFTKEAAAAKNIVSTHPSNGVLKFDDHVLANIRETYRGARSFTEWAPNADPIGDIGQFQTIPLLATVDRRPIIVRKQLIDDKKNRLNLAANGKLLGCAMTGATFISDLELLELKHYAPTCDVCFQFVNHKDMTDFVPSLGYEVLKPGLQSTAATKCFEGEATVEARFADWQRGNRRFKGSGYQWHVDCALPNGIQELTCREISRMMQDDINLLDDSQKIYFKTKFELDGWFRQPDSDDDWSSQKRRFRIHTEWPWTAVKSHDDDRSAIANGLSTSWNDIDSKFVPSNHHEMSLAHVEGPGYDQSEYGGHISLKSMNADKLSKGGIHPRLVSNLFHLIRNAPGSTHMLAVVDGQAQRSYNVMLMLLNTSISDLFKMYGKVFRNVGTLNDQDLIPISSMNPIDVNSSQPSMTLLELLRIRKIKIHMVPIITPSLVFEKTVCGGQYTFTPYLAARYSADYQVIMYIDGDTTMVESSNKRTLNEILYDRFFGQKSSKCAGHRMRLIEQYVKPEYNNNEAVLQCTQNLALDKRKWQYALKNCHLKEGHIVARTDSVYAFSVHHPDTLDGYLPEGVDDCIPPYSDMKQKAMLQDIKHKQHELISRYYLGEDEFVQLHLRDRERKAECACFFEP
jgi:hypothetical protein